MSFLKWDESLSVGVEMFDNEHKTLIKMINEYDAVENKAKSKGGGSDAVRELVDKLIDYTIYHLSHEEELFDKLKYSEASTHKEAHRKFRETILATKSMLDQGKTVYSTEITNLITDWLLTHISVEDKKYTRFFNDNGLT